MVMILFKEVVTFALAVIAICNVVDSQLVPAIITFGDSSVDIGNNAYIHTFFKANYPPYGRDFPNQQPTGRFSNGKLATDITAETLGFTTYPPAYLSPQASGQNLLLGANFASAGSGYDDLTAHLSHVVPLSQQFECYKGYKNKLANVAGSSKAESIIRDALYIVSTGSSDFVQNYYVNPYLYKTCTPDQYASKLVAIFSNFIKDLYACGARRIGVTSLPPLGCIPVTKTLNHESGCVSRVNRDAQCFNEKLNSTVTQLQQQLSGLRIVVFDIYTPLYELIRDPPRQGFAEAGRGCCGTGTLETTVILCNRKSIGTCENASEYVFWDSVHPSQAANQVLANALLSQGISLIG